MKKCASFILAVIMVVSILTSCAGNEQEYIDINDNTFINDYTDTVETAYEETDIVGTDLYNQLFDINNKVTVNINMTKEEIGKLQEDYKKYTDKDENTKSETYRKADVTFTINDKSYTVDEVGIRLKGNMSIRPFYSFTGTPNLCSFKLSFDETFDNKERYPDDAKEWTAAEREKRKKRTFATLDKLDLKWNISYDETNIREIYATQLFSSQDLMVQNIGLSQLTLNGNNYGLIKIYEPVDKKFLEKRLPKAAQGGDLYKCIWTECDSSGNKTGKWHGVDYSTDNSYGIQDNENGIKYNFNLKTNKKSSKHETLINFLNVINKPGVSKEELEQVLDVDAYAKFMAAEYFAGDPDDMRNNFNNHYIYFRKDNGKAVFIVYDNDRTMGITYGMNKNCAEINPFSNSSITMGEQKNKLIKDTITSDARGDFTYIRDKYSAALDELSKSDILSSDAKFNEMYEKAKANYEDIITPYMEFANQEKSFEIGRAHV